MEDNIYYPRFHSFQDISSSELFFAKRTVLNILVIHPPKSHSSCSGSSFSPAKWMFFGFPCRNATTFPGLRPPQHKDFKLTSSRAVAQVIYSN